MCGSTRSSANCCSATARRGSGRTTTCKALDPLLYKHKVQYVLENPVDALCLNFTDVLHDTAADAAER